MNETKRLADQLERALNGEAWHGPSWKEALDGVTFETAVHRPIPEAHSIAEIVMHAGTWHDVVRRRIEGESPQVSDEEDWPPPPKNEKEWSAAVTRLLETGQALSETVAAFPVSRLEEMRPGVNDSWYGLLIGELQHVLYHAGQVSLLRKAAPKAGKK
jgi:hypothetical protein